MKYIRPRKYGESDHISGTTTDNYADALDWDTRGLGWKTIVIKNTHSANSMLYKILIRCEYDNGNDLEEVTETTLAAGDDARNALNNSYARVKVQVKAATAGSQATFDIDYIGNPAQGAPI